MDHCGVYVIIHGQSPRSKMVKLGIAICVKRRLNQIQLASPVKIKPLSWLPTNFDKARELESYLHQTFHEHRKHGEWFRFDPKTLQFVLSCGSFQPWPKSDCARCGLVLKEQSQLRIPTETEIESFRKSVPLPSRRHKCNWPQDICKVCQGTYGALPIVDEF